MWYELTDTVDKLRLLDSVLMTEDKPNFPIIAYDTEANGVKLYKASLIGFSISPTREKGYYVPFLRWVPNLESLKVRTVDKEKIESYMTGHLECVWTGQAFPEFVTPEAYDIRRQFPLLAELMERWLSPVDLLMWNAPYDVNMTKICTGVDLAKALWLDGSLLVHALDENDYVGLKDNQQKYATRLGYDHFAQATSEKKELYGSILKNGGNKAGEVWRGDLEYQAKYAVADTRNTFGICEIAVSDFADTFEERGMRWFFETEVMPLCKEVVFDMKAKGVQIDVRYFAKLAEENEIKLNLLEDEVQATLNEQNLLTNFNVGGSIEDEISERALVKEIMRLEGVPMPTKTDKKTGEVKDSIAKAEVKKAYQANPHWILGYLLGEDEIKYSKEQLDDIRLRLFREKTGKRHRFNIGSSLHLRWLFCDVLGQNKAKLPQTDSATKENPIPQMTAEVLEEFFLVKHPFVQKLLSWKKLSKLQSTYVLPALQHQIDGFLNMEMKQNGTTSGRFSCSGGYNLQTLPRVDDEMELLSSCEKCHSENVVIEQDLICMANLKCSDCGHHKTDIARPSAIKRGFIAPEGMKIINADFESLEPKIFSFMSGEEALKDVYRKGLDLYSQVYCEIFDTNKEFSADPKQPNFLKKVAKAKRTWVKPIVLAIPYGAKCGQVASMVGAVVESVDSDGEKVKKPDFKRGQEIIDAYLDGFPSLKQYMEDQELKAVTQCYVETLVGRRRHFPKTKVIIEVFDRYSIDFRDFLELGRQTLTRPTVSAVVRKNGHQIHLPYDALIEVMAGLKIKKSEIPERGWWSFIKSVLKNDLDVAKNAPIQGLAAHITNLSMLKFNRLAAEQGLEAWVCLQVHDEITAYARTEHAEQAALLLKEAMEDNEYTALIDIPMVADPIICDNLMESK